MVCGVGPGFAVILGFGTPVSLSRTMDWPRIRWPAGGAALAVVPGLAVDAGLGPADEAPVAELLGDGLPEGEVVGDGLPEGEPVGDGVAVAVGLGVALGLGEWLAAGFGVQLGDPERCGRPLWPGTPPGCDADLPELVAVGTTAPMEPGPGALLADGAAMICGSSVSAR